MSVLPPSKAMVLSPTRRLSFVLAVLCGAFYVPSTVATIQRTTSDREAGAPARVPGTLLDSYIEWHSPASGPGQGESYKDVDADNPPDVLRGYVTPEGLSIVPGRPEVAPWRLDFKLTAFGRQDDPQPVPSAVLARFENGIELIRTAPIAETYAKSAAGLEQTYTLVEIARGQDAAVTPFFLEFSLGGDVIPTLEPDGRTVMFSRVDGETVMRYEGFRAFDAAGNALAPRVELIGAAPGADAVMRLVIPENKGIAPITIQFDGTSPATEPVDEGALAAPEAIPANDQCAGAEVISSAGPGPFVSTLNPDISGATSVGDPPLPSCQSQAGLSTWYTFAAPWSGNYTISTCASDGLGTTVDRTVATVYNSSTSACGGVYTQLSGSSGCDSNSCSLEPNQAVISAAPLVSGTTYFIVIWQNTQNGPPTVGNTAVRIKITPPPPPPSNDACGSATALVLDTPVTGTTQLATNDYALSSSAPTCFTLPAPPVPVGQTSSQTPGRDVAYSFQAPTAGTYSFRVTGYSTSQNAVLYVTSACPTGPIPITVATGPPCIGAANRNASNGAEEVVCVSLSALQSVFVFVDDHVSGNAGSTFTVEATRCTREIEGNGTPATANAIGCPVEGAADTAGDVDFFALGSPVAQSRVFTLTDTISSNNGDLNSRVTTATDTLEYDDDDGDAAFGASGFEPVMAGTRLTGASSAIRMNHDSGSVVAEPYRLYSLVEPPSATATAESEPNDTIVQAQTSANDYVAGTLASGNVDILGFCAAKGDLIFAGMDCDPSYDNTPINGTLALLDAAGATLLSVNGSAANSSVRAPVLGSLSATSPVAAAESLVWRARYGGAYYVRTSAASTGDYLLAVGKNCQPATGVADLTISKLDTPDPVAAGGTLTYSITVTNAGSTGACGLSVTDPLPASTLFQSISAGPWACTVPEVGSTGTVACTLGSLGAGESALLSVEVKVEFCLGEGQILSNTATVSGLKTDPTPGNNAAAATTTIADPGCEDGNLCTDDVCDPVIGCSHPNNTTPCDDGNACTVSDTCSAGACTPGGPLNCDDGNVCTDDGCNPATGCTHTNNALPCDDGSACTVSDVCAAGICMPGAAPNCDDGNACTDDGCDPATGCTHADNTGACGDGNPCTDDGCDPSTGCTHTNNTSPCDDGNPCTAGDACRSGVCICTIAGTFTTQIDAYLDPASGEANDTRFDYSSAINGTGSPACSVRRDVVFNCGYYDDTDVTGSGPRFVCSVSFDLGRSVAFPKNPGHHPQTLTAAGWYTFRHEFKDVVGVLVIDMEIVPLGSAIPAASWTIYASADPSAVDGAIITAPEGPVGAPSSPLDFVSGPGANVGGSRYGWIASNELAFLALDNTSNTDASFDQGFETDNSGWDALGGQYDATRVPSGTSGVPSGTGGFHGVAGRSDYDSEGGSAFSEWGSDRNLRCAFPGGQCPEPDCDDGNVCTDDSCDLGVPGGCVHTPIICDDGNACTTNGCDPSSGCTYETASCDDGNVCTDDGCNPETGCTHTNNTGPCEDGSACTTVDTCSAGACAGGPPPDCNDGNVCTDDGCDPATGCTHTNNTAPCDDGSVCTTVDTCSAGACAGGPPPNCDDGNVCTDDGCDPATGCTHTNNTAPCEDGSACTVSDVCAAGACTPGGPRNCDDGNVCTDDGCDPATGCTHTNNTAPCDDGSACTTTDTCSAGACAGGPPPNCDDGNVCTDDGCDPATGCTHTNNTAPCEDGSACTVSDVCGAGVCAPGGPRNCNDGNVCTDDGCDPSTGCTHTNNTAPCEDGSACTTADICSAGACAGGPPPNCDDGNVCTDDGCDPATGCTHTNNTAPCDDGSACTTADTCSAGACAGGPPPNCDDGNPCTDDGCDPATGCTHTNNTAPCEDGSACTVSDVCGAGACTPGGPRNCDDGNVCTDDGCDPATGCTHTNNTAPCEDGSACTTSDTCSAGACAGGPPPNCDDGNVCTNDGCDPATGCTHTNNTAPCEDGSACTTSDTCSAGACAGGPPPDCNDGNVCTDDGCDPATGCTHTNNTAPCEDGSACTVSDVCAAGACMPGGPRDCDDENMCTDDGCEPATGCTHTNNTAACDDGSACTTADTCSAGACAGGPPPNCDDGNPCTDDGCDLSTGCTHTNNTAPCEDGSACTVSDVCAAGACMPGGPRNCDDGNVCTDDGCEPATGCTHSDNTAPCNDGNPCTVGDACSSGVCVCTAAGTFTTRIDAYLDPASGEANDTRFDYSSAINGTGSPACSVRRDVVFNCGFYDDTDATGTGPRFVCSVSFDLGRSVAFPKNPGHHPQTLTAAGWYTFRHEFKDVVGVLVIDMEIVPLGSAIPAASWTIYASSDASAVDGAIIMAPEGPVGTPSSPLDFVSGPGANVGGSRYGWIASNELAFLALDNTSNTDAAFDQGFETDNSGWDVLGGQYDATRVPSGTSGVPSGTGGFHGLASHSDFDLDGGSSFTEWGSNRNLRCAFPVGTCPEPDCDDGDACTTDGCDPSSGCTHEPVSCDDGNVCTNDGCDPATGCAHTNNTAPCEDGSACTTVDTCGAGACAGGPPPDCDDGNVCTDDGCEPATGCTQTNNTAPCEDGSACTVSDICGGGACIPGGPRSCDDGNVCTDDGCEPATGCTHTNNTAPCEDGSACTTVDTCGAGACAGGPPPDCDDGNPCTDDGCESATGCTHTNNTAPCEDGSACTVSDICGGGACIPGGPRACDDGNVCTDDGCDPATGCTHTNNTAPCDDGSACTTVDTCGAGACAGGPPPDCDDGNVCTDDGCEPSTGCTHTNNTAPCEDGSACTVSDTCGSGACIPGGPRACDDGNVCTDDGCDPSTGCTHTNNTAPCDDGSACTTADTCGAGACAGGPPPDCDDGNVCTDDGCDPATGCTHTNNTAPCEDGSACTVSDTCGSGACIPGGPRSCDDGNVCTDDGCEPSTGCTHTNNTAPCDDGSACTTADTCGAGACAGGPPPDCDDGNVCTDDGCEPSTGCTHTNNTAPCDDGSACTTVDTCGAGACAGGPPPDCDDGNVCTDDGCEPSTGCTHTNNTAPCDDGSACTTVDTCGAGACAGGPPPDCDDGNVCTNDGCEPSTGCTHTNNTAPCDDGSACTTADTCGAGACAGGPPPDCDDGNVCTDDGCNPSTGCAHTNNTAPCEDGSACTTADTCSAGACAGGPPPICDDGDACTTDTCVPASGCVFTAIVCDDGVPCTDDICVDGSCRSTPHNCDDGNACTDEVCNPSTGICEITPDDTNSCSDGNPCTVDACVGGLCTCPGVLACTGPTVHFDSTDVPRTISATGTPVVTSTLTVTGVGSYLLDLDLTTGLTHTFPSDMDITLTSPSGKSVTISSDNGGTNDNVFNGTVWDDQADPGNQVPFPANTFAASNLVTDHLYAPNTPVPTLVPEETFGLLIGENPNGVWTLTISDDTTTEGGALTGWSLDIVALASAPTETTASFNNTTPVTIPLAPGVISSTLPVSGLGTSIGRIRLTTSITHTNNADLDITLTSPTGRVLTLTSDNGGSNDNVFNGTLWSDGADAGNAAPFSSDVFVASNIVSDRLYVNVTSATPLAPEDSFALFNGGNPNGTWTLRISDDTVSNGGVLNSWTLDVTTIDCTPSCAVSCDDANPCTDDTCSPSGGGCTHTDNAAPCSDGDPCTLEDACSGGACTGTPSPTPKEVNSSVLVTKSEGTTTIRWDDPPGPCNVYRGSRAPGTPWTYNQGCMATALTSNSVIETLTPPAGVSFWYLVTRMDACGESIPGRASDGDEIPNQAPCAASAAGSESDGVLDTSVRTPDSD